MELLAFLTNVYFVNKALERSTQRNYLIRARAFQKWMGRPVLVEEFTDTLLNRYLMYLQEKGVSSHTCHSARNSLKAIWNEAYKREVASKPVQLRVIRCHETPKNVWTPQEVARLVLACDKLGGCLEGTELSTRDYFRSLILAAWDTALRRGDLQLIPCGSINDDGTLLVCQNKTKRNVRVLFSQTTMRQIREFECEPIREFIWPKWSEDDQEFYPIWRRLIKYAGLKGPFKQLRKSAATAVEMIRPNAATPLLGHANRATTERWYLNSIVNDSMPKPPEIRLEPDSREENAWDDDPESPRI